MRKKPTRKRPYFTMESALTAILRDASGKMHHGILFDRRLENGKKKKTLPCSTASFQTSRYCRAGTQFINYKYIRIHLKVCLTVSLFLCFVFSNSRSIRLN